MVITPAVQPRDSRCYKKDSYRYVNISTGAAGSDSRTIDTIQAGEIILHDAPCVATICQVNHVSAPENWSDGTYSRNLSVTILAVSACPPEYQDIWDELGDEQPVTGAEHTIRMDSDSRPKIVMLGPRLTDLWS